MMWTKKHLTRRGKLSMVGAVVASGALAGVASADFLQADTDALLTGAQNSEVKLDAEPGQVLEIPVYLYVGCSQKAHIGTKTITSVTASYDAAASTVAESANGGALSATSATIPRPATWPADGSECPKGPTTFTTTPVRSTVTVTAPSTTGLKEYVVRWKTNDADVQAGSNGGGSSNITIKLNVKAAAPVDKTPPVITKVVSGTLGANGWYRSTATVAWSVTDPESPVTIVSGCGVDSFTQSASAATSSCSVSSLGGTASDSVTLKIDKDAPAISPGDVNDTTWRNSPLSQAFTASDAPSGLATPGDAGFTLTASPESTKDAAGPIPTTVSKTVYDAAGNSATRSLSALIDVTDPVIVDRGATALPNGSNGWYTTAVSNSFSASDALSGLPAAFASPFAKSSGTGEGSAVTINSGPVSDVAGNTHPGIDSAAVKIDLSNPLIGVTDTNAATSDVCASTRPQKPGFAPSDAISDIDAANTSDTWTPNLQPSGVGSYSYSATAQDLSGRTATYGPKTYAVKYGDASTGGAYGGIQQPVNADGSSRFKLGSTVPVKFRLACGAAPLTNAVAKLTVGQSDLTADAGVDEAISTSAATTGNLFRYDATSGHYIFNLSTKAGYTNPNGQAVAFSGGTWFLTIGLDDGTNRTTKIQIVKVARGISPDIEAARGRRHQPAPVSFQTADRTVVSAIPRRSREGHRAATTGARRDGWLWAMHAPRSGIEVVAHRGASAHAPEHTWAAYDLALALGADALELDLRATADGELVVLHDPTLARTAGDPRRIEAVALAELLALAAATRPLPLDAVLARYGERTRFLLELKDPQPPIEARSVETVARAGMRDRDVVQSFDEPGLRRVHTPDPGLRVAPLYRVERRARLLSRLDAAASYACAIGLHHRTVDPVIVRCAHERGLRVRAFTVNAPAEALRLVELGVDGLITDAPGRLSAAVRPVAAAAA